MHKLEWLLIVTRARADIEGAMARECQGLAKLCVALSTVLCPTLSMCGLRDDNVSCLDLRSNGLLSMTAGPSPSTATQDVSPPSAPLAGQKDVDPQQQRQAGYSYYHVPDFMTIPVIGPLPTRYRTLTFSAGFLCGQASLYVQLALVS